MSISSGTVRYNLIRKIIEIRKEIRLKKPQVTNGKILELLKEGNSVKKISKTLGVSTTSVYHRIILINGVKRDRSKG